MKGYALSGIMMLGLADCSHGPRLSIGAKVPVAVSCISHMPAVPEYPVVQAGEGLFVRVQKLLAERELRIAYEGKLEAALSACR